MSETEIEQSEPGDEPDEQELVDDEQEAEEGEPTPEPEPEPEPESQVDEEQQKRLSKITTSFKTYSASVERNMGDELTELLACPLCFGTDHPAYLNVHGAGRVPDEVKEAVLLYLGFAREQDYEPDPQSQECPACKGKGKLKRHTNVPGKETRVCSTCNGEGDVSLTGTPLTIVGNGDQREATFTLAREGEIVTDADNWGEPKFLPDGRENPNWGRQPQFKVPVEPWGVTAGLNAVSAEA